AAALGELARERWKAAEGPPIAPPRTESDPWPEGLEPDFTDVELAIARTRGAYGDIPVVREIEALFVDMIARAERFVYAENQFFASRVIGKAIAARLAEPEGPEFVIVNPKRVEGWLEEEVMTPARARLMRALAEGDRHDRLRVYTPVSEGGNDIYVHSKIVVIDDVLLRVGSANMNNRSMGLDSECDLLLDAHRDGNDGAAARIAALRADLLAEHLDVTPAEVEARLAETGSLIATIEALRGSGRTLELFVPEEPNALEAAIADSEALDPESAGEDFEPIARPGLFAGLRAALRRRRRR
ncbi:MAG: phospholipase, partial [Sphingomonadaceae bacterium]|nr:phospholipase [Sphingomonadaceae bacterium]